jgi:dipeptidyl aminopeptidase/acylaminoacyl peptidase
VGAAGAATPTSRYGSQMVLRKLADGGERPFADVLEYALAKDGKGLAFSVASSKPETDGVFVLATAGGEPRGLITGKGRYEHVTWDDGLDQLAFIGNPGEGPDADEAAGKADAKKTPYKLYLWKSSEPKAAEIVATSTPGFHPGYVLAEHATLNFSKDGSKLFFGAAPPPPPPHATAIDQDKPSFDLWRTEDDYIQPVQRVRAPADLNRSFRAVYLIRAKKMLQLADDTLPELVPNETGRYALGTDDRAYRAQLDYGNRTGDYYLVDVETGARIPVLKKQEGVVRWSGDGKYLLSFDGKDWSSIAVPSAKITNLTANLPAKFFNEENDVPAAPGPYGVGAWSKDDKYVLLYDHFDVWQVAPEGGSATNLTEGEGRRDKLEFRYVKTDPDAEVHAFDPAQPILLRAESSVSHDSGFYSTKLGAKQPPTKLLFMDKDFSNPVKAEHANTYVLTEQTFTQFPDLLVTDASFSKLERVSDANPQKAGLAWGTDEMIHFESLDGVPLEGVLYKPANFDPSKKYPMIVYLYEKLSENIHHFVDPKPMDSINIAYYVSNGYLVFTPDIVYTIGYPGQSALKCVLAGVNAVTRQGFVDEKNIGIQGHSWGGYQIAYMVTQTNRFKAAEDGAPVVNMISAYDGIRWGPGRPRQFQYEQTQSRIGGTPWQVPLRYIDNSPIFYAERIQTPLLLLHNDADDAVPWYQGIEFFLALRRLGKEAYLFTYNGEPHHLHRRPNQKDYATRMAQYFDFELKGGPKPAWMEKGIPYLHTPEQFTADQDDKE